MKYCDAKEAAKIVTERLDRLMNRAEYTHKRENSKITLKFDSGLIQIYEPSIRAFVVMYDPKKPNLVKLPTQAEIEQLKL